MSPAARSGTSHQQRPYTCLNRHGGVGGGDIWGPLPESIVFSASVVGSGTHSRFVVVQASRRFPLADLDLFSTAKRFKRLIKLHNQNLTINRKLSWLEVILIIYNKKNVTDNWITNDSFISNKKAVTNWEQKRTILLVWGKWLQIGCIRSLFGFKPVRVTQPMYSSSDKGETQFYGYFPRGNIAAYVYFQKKIRA